MNNICLYSATKGTQPTVKIIAINGEEIMKTRFLMIMGAFTLPAEPFAAQAQGVVSGANAGG
jgi:hypothetical protein